MKDFPQNILFIRDETEAKFCELIPKLKTKTTDEAWYEFTKSHSALGKRFVLTLPQLEKMFDHDIAKSI